MSREAVDWAWEDAPVTDPRQLLILLSIADVSDEYGENAFPSIARMSRDSRSDKRTVSRHLKAMIDIAVLLVQSRATQHRPTTYAIPGVRASRHDSLSSLIQARHDSLSSLNSTNSTPDMTQACHRHDTDMTKSNSSPIELGTGIGIELITSQQLEQFQFSELWDAYPRRNGKRLNKGKTEALWEKLSTQDKALALIGSRFYADAVAHALTIAKDPDRWLRDHCWVDWQEAAVEDIRQRVDPLRRGAPSIASQRDRLRAMENDNKAISR